MQKREWFRPLFGFDETSYQATRNLLYVESGRLHSKPNGASYAIGEFATPALSELRAAGKARGMRGEPRIHHEAVDDILELHGLSENEGALFQVASQFNCLEFLSPEAVPEDGVSAYAWDATQGPACALAAAAATVYRNYFAPVNGQTGQTRDNQIDNLAGLAQALGDRGKFWDVRNGHTFGSAEQLAALADELSRHDRDALLGEVRIGLQRDVGVTFSDRFTQSPPPERLVSQAFCSAVSCAYAGIGVDSWEPLAKLVLDAAYEATLWAAVINGADRAHTPRVWLTQVGGGAFGNRKLWIAEALARAIRRLGDFDLDVRVAHYCERDLEFEEMVRGYGG